MTDRELDERIAKALGWGINSYDPDYFNVDHCGTVISRRDFSPSTSVDALRRWVLPEIIDRGLFCKFCRSIFDVPLEDRGFLRKIADKESEWLDEYAGYDHDNRTDVMSVVYSMHRALMLPPSTLAAAALAVLEDDNAK